MLLQLHQPDRPVTHFILFILFLFCKIRRTKQILNLYKYLRVHWLGLTTEINSNNGSIPIKKTNYYTCTKIINWLSPNCQQHDLKDKFLNRTSRVAFDAHRFKCSRIVWFVDVFEKVKVVSK